MPTASVAVDTAGLATLIHTCFDMSMTSGIRQNTRDGYASTGRRLRGNLMTLLSARFAEGTDTLERANTSIAGINQALAADEIEVKSYARLLEKATRLAGVLDKLIATTATFL